MRMYVCMCVVLPCNVMSCTFLQNKDTPLHEASWAGHAIVIEVLISLKADVDAVNRVRLLM